MENNYRNMMDEVQAPDGLRESVLNITGQERTKKTRSTPVRVLTVAACICALLVVVAVAAEIAGFDFVQIFKGTEEGGWDYTVDVSDLIELIPVKELPPEIQTLEEEYQDKDIHNVLMSFDSWEEAEAFLGWEIADNPVLADSRYAPNKSTYEGHNEEGNCIVSVIIKYGKVSAIRVDARYDLSFPRTGTGGRTAADIFVDATLYVGDEPLIYGAGMGYIADGSVAEGQENYLTENGLAVVIVNMIDNPDTSLIEHGEYHANFVLRGASFWVRAMYFGPEDQETVLAGLKEVLDNFQ